MVAVGGVVDCGIGIGAYGVVAIESQPANQGAVLMLMHNYHNLVVSVLWFALANFKSDRWVFVIQCFTAKTPNP